MNSTKYSKLLTVLLILIIVLILGLVIFFGIDVYRKYYIKRNSEKALEQFYNQVGDPETEENTMENDVATGEFENPFENIQKTGSSGSSTTVKSTYKGFTMSGTIKIPKINLEYPVLEEMTKASIEVSVAIMYGPGLNQVGNTVIVGHNYRNGVFFSNNKKLSNGDKIYITDASQKQITYTIYNIYETNPEDIDYALRDTEGKREISLSTCTDDSKNRLIIWAKED